MVYKKGTDLEKNIKIQLIYLLSKHTYIQRLKSSFFTRTQLQRFKLISKLFYLFRISAKLCFCPISSFKL